MHHTLIITTRQCDMWNANKYLQFTYSFHFCSEHKKRIESLDR